MHVLGKRAPFAFAAHIAQTTRNAELFHIGEYERHGMMLVAIEAPELLAVTEWSG